MILHSYFRSSCSYRVRIALNLKEVDYQIAPVHLIQDGGQQHSPDYIEKNPMHVVPTLSEGDVQITQSMAIVEYLEARFPEYCLFPGDLKQQARIREICEIINSGIQPLQNLAVLQKLAFDEARKVDWIQHWIGHGFQATEKLLGDSKFCVGQTPTAADCFLIPQVYNAIRFKLDMSQFPKISEINERCLAIDAFQKAAPNNQPDAPV